MKVAEKLYPLRERRGRGGSDMAIMFDGNFFIAVIASTILSFVIGGIWYAGPRVRESLDGRPREDRGRQGSDAQAGAERVRGGIGRRVHRVFRARPVPIIWP